jgi:hypothetical protein
MEPQIDEHTDGHENREAEDGPSGFGSGLEGRSSLLGMTVLLCREDQQADGGKNGGASGVKQSFESVDAKGIGDGNFVLALNQ